MVGGRFVDPFAADGEVTLWRHPACRPHSGAADTRCARTEFAAEAVDAVLHDLRDGDVRAAIAAEPDLWLRGWQLAIEAATYPTRFGPSGGAPLFPAATRAAHLDLPFAAADFDDVTFADDAGLR
jgi:hypothetical protein